MSGRTTLIVSDDVPGEGAQWLAACIGAGPAHVALSGGSTPRPLYERLGTLPLPWERIDFYNGDERCVPPDSPHSNYRMARAALPAAARLHRIEVERADVVARYASLLPDVLDVVVLGMGADLHTGSLFPGTDWSRLTGRKVIATLSPRPPRERITITPDVIRAARHVLVVVTGAAKAVAVRRALTGEIDPVRFPVHIVRDATWLLDGAAASLLMEKTS